MTLDFVALRVSDVMALAIVHTPKIRAYLPKKIAL